MDRRDFMSTVGISALAAPGLFGLSFGAGGRYARL